MKAGSSIATFPIIAREQQYSNRGSRQQRLEKRVAAYMYCTNFIKHWEGCRRRYGLHQNMRHQLGARIDVSICVVCYTYK
jgi:hypothetical protein